MAKAAEHNKQEGTTKRIWMVFWILAIVTSIEVILGIGRPSFLTRPELINMHLLNWIFILLTIVKAYYITFTFMHMEHEKASLRRAVVWTAASYIVYMLFILLAEGDYIHDMLANSFVAWKF